MSCARGLRLAIFGPPAGGKGTIAGWMARDLGLLAPISTGDLLRRRLQANIATGSLFPDEYMWPLVQHALEGKAHWILDGFPRTLKQAQLLDSHCAPDAVIAVRVPEDALRERMGDRWIHLSSGRTYNARYNPPLNPGIDDATGEPLVRRLDDQTVCHLCAASCQKDCFDQRMQAYRDNAADLCRFYRARWLEFEGSDSAAIYASVKPRLHGLLQQPVPLPCSGV